MHQITIELNDAFYQSLEREAQSVNLPIQTVAVAWMVSGSVACGVDLPTQTTQPDWSKAPEWARYWAVDSDGTAYWYEFEPVILPGLSFEGWHPASLNSRWEETDSKVVQPWRNTLQERPQS